MQALTAEEMVQKQADDALRSHAQHTQSVSTTAGSSAEVDALQSILNNINVQTSRSNQAMTIDTNRLPPI